MFSAYETALIQHLEGVIPGAPVVGTLDEPDMTQHALFVKVQWQGYRISGQPAGRSVAAVTHTFAVRVVVGDCIDQSAAEAAINGLSAVLHRVLSFTYGERPGVVRATLIDPPPPAYQGAAAELAVYFTLPGIAARSA